MKIAVLGSSVAALEVALKISDLGGHPIIFNRSQAGGLLKSLAKLHPEFQLGPWKNITSEIGRKSIGLDKDLDQCALVTDYLADYIEPLFLHLRSSGFVKDSYVNQVSKRFLNKNEEIEGKSRFHDLFRVLYHRDPEESINSQKETNPEIFDQLGDSVIQSLKKGVEAFEDFDVVIDTRSNLKKPLNMGPGGALALNEYFLKDSEEIFYSREVLEEIGRGLKDTKTISLIGEGYTSAITLWALSDWLKEKSSEFHFVCSSKEPFYKLKEKNPAAYEQLVAPVLNFINQDFKDECFKFESQMSEWRSLEEYERAKVSKPVEPVPRLKVFTGFEVTSLDRLMDRKGLFLTLESPDYRHLNREILMTLATDKIFVDKGHYPDNETFVNFQDDEKGLIKMNLGLRDLGAIESEVESVINKLTELFTKVED